MSKKDDVLVESSTLLYAGISKLFYEPLNEIRTIPIRA